MIIETLFISLVSFSASITYIGDSQSASSNGLLANLGGVLRNHGGVNTGRAVCGAVINDYIRGGVRSRCNYRGITHMSSRNGRVSFPAGRGRTQKIGSLAATSDVVVIQLGDNHLSGPGGAKRQAKVLIRKILSKGKQCIWIGPAALPRRCSGNRAKKVALNRRLKQAVAEVSVGGNKCRYIDSLKLTRNSGLRSGDCLHYKRYKPWARAIASDLGDALDSASGSNFFESVQRQPAADTNERSESVDSLFTFTDDRGRDYRPAVR